MINRFLILILTFFTIPVMVKGERSLDLSGIWNVELGDGINRPVSLPGTTDAASLGYCAGKRYGKMERVFPGVTQGNGIG